MNYILNSERLNINIYIQKNSKAIQVMVVVVVDILIHMVEIVMLEIVEEDVMAEQLEVGKITIIINKYFNLIKILKNSHYKNYKK